MDIPLAAPLVSQGAWALPARLAVIIPIYSEAANIRPLVQRLDAALSGIPWEAIFVDDDSPDGSGAILRDLGALDPRIRCLRRIGRRGLATACIEGFLGASAPFVAVMDGDLQHDETILPAMLRAVENGADLAIGSRHVDGGTANGGFSAARGSLSGAGAWLAQRLLPVPLSDPMSGFFLMRRTRVEEVAPRLTGSGFKILLDIVISIGRPLRVVELPYRFRSRTAGDSKLDIAELTAFLGLLFDKAMHGLVPLRFLAFAGVGAIGLGIHMATLVALLDGFGVDFQVAQGLATLLAMTANFWLNNRLTFRAERRRGQALWRGLLLFYLVCGIGVAANLGIAQLLVQESGWQLSLAGAAGAVLTLVWNYAVSATLVWR